MASARAESAFLRAHSIRFNPYLYLTGRRAETAGFPPGSACYTLVSCGERHVRFWTLDRQWHPRGVHSGGDGGRDAGDGGGEWMWSLHSKPGHFGRRGDMSDATCVTFIGEPRARGNHRTGRYGTMDPSVQRLPAARTVTGTKSGHVRASVEGLSVCSIKAYVEFVRHFAANFPWYVYLARYFYINNAVGHIG